MLARANSSPAPLLLICALATARRCLGVNLFYLARLCSRQGYQWGDGELFARIVAPQPHHPQRDDEEQDPGQQEGRRLPGGEEQDDEGDVGVRAHQLCQPQPGERRKPTGEPVEQGADGEVRRAEQEPQPQRRRSLDLHLLRFKLLKFSLHRFHRGPPF